jgi:hypothetical protein
LSRPSKFANDEQQIFCLVKREKNSNCLVKSFVKPQIFLVVIVSFDEVFLLAFAIGQRSL